MTMRRQLHRLGVVSAGAIILGMTSSGAGHAENCDGNGGALTTSTHDLCRTVAAGTSGLQGTADGATGGDTQGLTTGARKGTGQAMEMTNQAARQIDGAPTSPGSGAGSGAGSANPKQEEPRPLSRTGRGAGSDVDAVAVGRPSIPGFQPLAGLRPADGGDDAAQLPQVASAPWVTRPTSIEQGTMSGPGFVIVAAAGAGAAGLVGGGHLGLLLARARRRQLTR